MLNHFFSGGWGYSPSSIDQNYGINMAYFSINTLDFSSMLYFIQIKMLHCFDNQVENKGENWQYDRIQEIIIDL